MALPIIPIVLLGGGLAALGYAALAKRPTVLQGAVAQELLSRLANKGPKGEFVFKPDVATSVLRSLASKQYVFADPNDRSVVRVLPNQTGAPLSASSAATSWVSAMNSQFSILAPLTIATTADQQAFLRAVPAGQEDEFTGAETGYAVLLYVGTIDRNLAPPGQPPGGGTITPIPPGGPGGLTIPPGGIPGLIPLPAPGGPPTSPEDADAKMRALIKKQLEDLCLNGQNPDQLDAVAAEVEKFGFFAEAECLRKKAAALRAKPPAPAVITPAGPVPVPAVVPVPTLAPQFAVVTTSDPPPLGDLKVFSDLTQKQQIGGAHKGGTVAVLLFDAGTGADGQKMSRISWPGAPQRVGVRGGGPLNGDWPAVIGFVRQRFLTPTSQAPIAPPPPTGQLAIPASTVPGFAPRARVTTNDPPPSGDLVVRSAPSASAKQIGGAEKNGLVELIGVPVMEGSQPWQQIKWGGGSRWPAVVGFAKAQFLVPVPATTIAGIHDAAPGFATDREICTVASSSGVRLRSRPGASGATLSLIPAGQSVRLLKLMPGLKADPRSPGRGGWALVEYEGKPGWVPSEWLV